MSMRRKIAGLKPSEIKNLAKDELDMPVTKQVTSSNQGKLASLLSSHSASQHDICRISWRLSRNATNLSAKKI